MESPCIQAIIFDLDGTLLDTESLSDKAILQALGDHLPYRVQQERKEDNHRLPWELKREIIGKPGNTWIPIVLKYAQQNWDLIIPEEACNETSNSSLSVSNLWNSWEANLNGYCANIQECQGATKLVETFNRMGLPMAIATSSRNSSVIQKRQKHSHLFSYMKHIVTGDDPAVRCGKPDPDIFLEAARRLGVKPSNCLVLEDSIAGCQAGKSAGCYVVAVPDPRMGRSEFYGIANEVIDSLDCFDGHKFGIQHFKTMD